MPIPLTDTFTTPFDTFTLRPIEDWGQLLGDVPAATAILDRFLQQAEVIPITGRSYRLRNQKDNSGLAAGKRR